mgnify:CR=1 FL=1
MEYPDIFFTPEYQELFKDTAFGGEPRCFRSAGIEYRFYARPIEETGYFDIVSPYGYSGPIDIDGQPDWDKFLSSFHSYCQGEYIIAEFARLHPFLQNHLYLEAGRVVKSGEVVYIDLTQSEEDIWRGFDKGCKSAIKKALKSEGRLMPPIKGCLIAFPELYCSTMKRNNAHNAYLFSDDFFRASDNLVHTIGALSLGGNLIAANLLLRYGDYCHYWLAGGQPRNGVGNLLLWEAIKWAKKQGCKIFNLGGGLTEGDNLSSFKRSFSKTTMPFFTYRKIHNPEIYNQLCQAKGIYPTSEGYFPAYRR